MRSLSLERDAEARVTYCSVLAFVCRECTLDTGHSDVEERLEYWTAVVQERLSVALSGTRLHCAPHPIAGVYRAARMAFRCAAAVLAGRERIDR